MSNADLPDSVIHEGGGGVMPPNKIDIYRQFIDFYAMPDQDKAQLLGIEFDAVKGRYAKKATLKGFAVKFGVHVNTLTAWKQREDFFAAVDMKQKQWGVELVPNVMASLYRRCIKYGISTDVELFLAYYKNWDRKQVVKHLTERFDMDDVRALLAPLPKEDQEKFYAILSDIIAKAEVLGGGEAVQGGGSELTAGDKDKVRE